MTECEEVADSMLENVLHGQRPETFDEAVQIVKKQMPEGENVQVIDNVAWALVHG